VPRQRNPNREKAYGIWIERNGEITNRELAELLNENEKVIAVWKQRDKWNVVQQSKTKVVQHTKATKKKLQKDALDSVIQDNELTEKQRLFCIYYVKTFNATQAMIKAGYGVDSAHVEGSRLLRNPKVADHIRKIKSDLAHDLFVEALDVLKKYVRIAFADITDYVKFGQREEQVIGMYGPVFEGEGKDKKPVMHVVNYVELNEANRVDGSIITEVKQGKDGVSIKLADKMKALEKLSLYFDLFPDKFKREIERERIDLEKSKSKVDEGPTEDDGFMEALEGKVSEVWDDGETES